MIFPPFDTRTTQVFEQKRRDTAIVPTPSVGAAIWHLFAWSVFDVCVAAGLKCPQLWE
jgi:hypothetical protein